MDTVGGGDFSFGVGLRIRFTKNLSAHAEWERFGLTGYDYSYAYSYDLGNADMLSAGLLYKF